MNRHRKILLVMALISVCLLSGCTKESAPISVRVGIPHSDYVQDLESNYYLNWLENQTGINIIPIEIRQTRCDEYLESLASSNAEIDMVLFGNDFIPTEAYIKQYAAEGHVFPLPDGSLTYMNNGTSKSEGCGQVMWINVDWLNALGLEIPNSTEELEKVLLAFKHMDPNQNGINDEIPLIGSSQSYALNPLYFLMNAFTYCDPYHTMHQIENGTEAFVPETDRFRAGTQYCRKLFEEGVIDKRLFTYSSAQLAEIINNPNDLVGAFTSESIGDVIYSGNPEIMAKYICILPIEGPYGNRNALYVKKQAKPGAIIIAGTGKEAACKELLDLMMTPEGSLIARFGEQGVDWDYSDGLDVSLYGEKAIITTINYLGNVPQNKNLHGIGPIKVPDDYLAGVTWNGVNSDMEYIDARAEMSYQQYLPKEVSGYPYDERIVGSFEKEWERIIKGEKELDEEMLSWNHLHSACDADSSSNGLQK